jgi:Eukaryotic porin
VDVAKGGKILSEAALRYNGIVVGAQAHVNAAQSGLENYSAALGYELSHYKATLHALNRGSLLSASFYQRFSSGVETGFKASWNRKAASQYGIELVAKFPLDHGSFLKCKLDNGGKMGVAYATPLNNKITLTMAAAFDTVKMDTQNHRLGLGLVVDL